MPLTPSFLASQFLGAPSVLVLADNSAGTDVSIVTRRVYLQKSDSTYLVPEGTVTDYILWDYADSSIDIDALDRDYALNITVEWLDVSDTIVYTKTTLFDFTLYAQQFFYQLTQYQTSNQLMIDNKNYYFNKIKLACSIDEANNAVQYGGDIRASQSALDRAKYLQDNYLTLFQ